MQVKLIELKSVNYWLSSRNVILKDINLILNKGEIITIIGPNGGGKSTLAKIILGLIQPSQGKVYISKKVKFGYMPQKIYLNNLMPITVDLFLKIKKDYKTSIFNDIVGYMSIDKLLDKQCNDLSGGEFQRVLFARALVSGANTIILDEPLQGLDINGQAKFYQRLDILRKEFGMTIIMISHDLHMVMQSTNQVICLNNHICCHGKPDQILKNKKYIDLFGNKLAPLSHYSHEHNHEH